MEPTDEQMKTLFRLCYQLTKYYVPVYLALLLGEYEFCFAQRRKGAKIVFF